MLYRAPRNKTRKTLVLARNNSARRQWMREFAPKRAGKVRTSPKSADVHFSCTNQPLIHLKAEVCKLQYNALILKIMFTISSHTCVFFFLGHSCSSSPSLPSSSFDRTPLDLFKWQSGIRLRPSQDPKNERNSERPRKGEFGRYRLARVHTSEWNGKRFEKSSMKSDTVVLQAGNLPNIQW